MVALADDRNASRQEDVLFGLPIAAAAVVYAGALVSLNSSGYVKPAANIAGEKFKGLAEHRADNTGGANAAKNVEGRRRGVYPCAASGMAITDEEEDAYIVDDQTVGLGIVAQPVSVTGVIAKRVANSHGGVYALAYTNTGDLLAWGGGTGVDVSTDGDYILTAPDGSQIMVTVTATSLPGTDQSDNLTLRYVRCGKIVEYVSATKVKVDIAG